ncbi:MAG: HAD family phosphatase [Bacteroidales bacterium]|nr:HAD family phosphatase [Bacteroidales bacterium]MCF8389629.1 HAD family phosphatase [Bacteroidales bacterium]
MKITDGIKNIIFDFGGVIINIDYFRTRDAFLKLGLDNFDEIYSQFNQNPIFDQFETGRINEDIFFSEIEKLSEGRLIRKDSIEAWNAMLLDFPQDNYEFLKSIKNKYRTFLLSNTNETHLEYYFNKLKVWYGIENMDPLFEKTYFSCRLNLRKPNVEIFDYVLKDSQLRPEETLFIDDSPQHVEGARKAGLRAFHLTKPKGIIDLIR